MISPYLFQDSQGNWHCIWSLNEEVGQFAHAATSDLYTWGRQAYPYIMDKGNVQLPEVSFQPTTNRYMITWLSNQDGVLKIYKTTTTDFKNYSKTIEGNESDRLNNRVEVIIDGETQTGIVSKVPWKVVEGLIKWCEWSQFHEQQRNESLSDDVTRFASLKSIDAEIKVKPDQSKSISDMLVGVFFEDINYSVDGGLYAELIQNRGFEYDLSDRKDQDKNWNSYTAWSFTGEEGGLQ